MGKTNFQKNTDNSPEAELKAKIKKSLSIAFSCAAALVSFASEFAKVSRKTPVLNAFIATGAILKLVQGAVNIYLNNKNPAPA